MTEVREPKTPTGPDPAVDIAEYYGVPVLIPTMDDGPMELWTCVYCGAYVHTFSRWSHTAQCRLVNTMFHNQLRQLPANDEFHRGGVIVPCMSGVFICDRIDHSHRALTGQPMQCPSCRRVMF